METIKLLIVDDEPGIREGARRVLEEFIISLPYAGDDYGFQITTAGSGEEALDLFRQAAFDMVLLDNKLPGIQGTEVLAEISRAAADCLCLMITAYASVETAVAATKNGAYDFLVKPFTPEELKSAVHKAGKHLILTRLTRKLAEEKNQIRFQFLSLVAHELKAPLDAVTGYLRLMEEGANGPDLEDYDHFIHRALTRTGEMKKLILDLLDLTGMESGARPRQLQAVDLAELARTAADNLRPAAAEKGILISVEPGSALYFMADPREMAMILDNLISNAVKYNREKGSVQVSLTPEPDGMTLRVADSGIGISPEEQEDLFREFFRVRNEKTRRIAGSGLGLSIVRKIVSLYNGNIRVESAPDRGSIFTVFLERGSTIEGEK